jgi:two-component system, OmpR family, KDP operon response regulator KdpE
VRCRGATLPAMARILLVEDDQRIRDALLPALRQRGHVITPLAGGMPALEQALRDPVEVVILDLGLPDVDGLELLRMLRAVSEVPVIVATARDTEAEIIAGLDAGADDYVVKPYSAEHLDARIRAVLRRQASARPTDRSVQVGGLRIDPSAREATLDGAPLDLTRLEFDLLRALAERAGEVVSKRELLAEVWHQPFGGGDRTVDVHLSWLRRKLGESAAEPRYLHTVRGVGVKLQPQP